MLLSEYKHFRSPPVDEATAESIIVRRLGLQDYQPIWRAMQYIADHPEKPRDDEIWLLSHKPVFTLGQAARSEHLLNPGSIPVVQTDRGGQVTYHGPGQLVAYLLLDLRRRKLGVRQLVDLIEAAVIDCLAHYQIAGQARAEAPGVYVDNAKIAALGLRVRNGRSYHGLSLNIDMDLEPFSRINPCGYQDLQVTQLADLVTERKDLLKRTSGYLVNSLLRRLGCWQIEREQLSTGIV